MKQRTKPTAYEPNLVPKSERVANVLLAIILLAFGLAGLLTARFDLWGRRVRIAVFEGGPAWLMASSCLVGALLLLVSVLDHYDKRDNEKYYKAFRWTATRLGWCLVAAALIAYLYMGLVR